MPQQKKKNGDLTVKNDKLSKQNIVLYFFGIIPVVWLGLLIAPCMDNGLVSLIQKFGTVMQNPFHNDSEVRNRYAESVSYSAL